MLVKPVTDLSFEESPCELCKHVARCQTGLACEAFAVFFHEGGRKWRGLPQKPSKKIFEKLYPDAT